MHVCHNRNCVIQFFGKEIKSFTEETLTKMIDLWEEWLNESLGTSRPTKK